MIDDIRSLLARHLSGYEVVSAINLGEGLDNAAYEVNGELVVRISKEADRAGRDEAMRREADLLTAVAEVSTLPVPQPIFADTEAGVLAYPKLPGLPLMDQPVAEPSRLTPALGEFLSGLHQADLERFEGLADRDFYPLSKWREDAERDYREILERLPVASRRLVEDFLGRPPPAESRDAVFCHNDLGAEHVLVDAGANAVTGVIDWTDAAVTDPARDLALIYRDLGPEVFDLTLAHYERDFEEREVERTKFYARCALLEDVAYGLSVPGARRYAEAGLANLARTFA